MQFLQGHNNVGPVGTKMNLCQIISQAEQMFTPHTHAHTQRILVLSLGQLC